LTRKNDFIDAHIGTLSRVGDLFLGKIKVPVLREFYQASCEIEGFSLKERRER